MNGVQESANSEDNPPFDDGRIKMKRIQGRGLGLSRTDRAAMYCC